MIANVVVLVKISMSAPASGRSGGLRVSLSSCRSSMTRTKRSQDSSSSDSTLSTMALPLEPGVCTGGSCAFAGTCRGPDRDHQ